MKMKYGNKIDYYFFPFLGSIVKNIIIPYIRYGNVYRNLVLNKRSNPNIQATVAGGDKTN